QNDGKKKVWRRCGTAHDPKHTTSSVKHGGVIVMAWACMAASGTGTLVFIDDVTQDRSNRINLEVVSFRFRNIKYGYVLIGSDQNANISDCLMQNFPESKSVTMPSPTFHSLLVFVYLSLQDQYGARSQHSQEADKPHRTKGKKKYTCDECGKDFPWARSLKRHQLVHSGERPFSCDDCGKSFTQSGSLKTHQFLHGGVKVYSCEECGKDFLKKDSLQIHEVIHTGERPFSCDLCGKSFSWKKALKTHQLIHSGVKAYSCDQCGRAFTHSSSLRSHLVTVKVQNIGGGDKRKTTITTLVRSG
uniref:C2H2-type domain-containing protein n=1 Tax=Maylandia zebra TaxID=106582 RepID=A0A3P9D9G7_9CICH